MVLLELFLLAAQIEVSYAGKRLFLVERLFKFNNFTEILPLLPRLLNLLIQISNFWLNLVDCVLGALQGQLVVTLLLVDGAHVELGQGRLVFVQFPFVELLL